MYQIVFWTLQILAASLIQCHKQSSEKNEPLSLKVFVAGRNRLENDGATALAQAFQVRVIYKENFIQIILNILVSYEI